MNNIHLIIARHLQATGSTIVKLGLRSFCIFRNVIGVEPDWNVKAEIQRRKQSEGVAGGRPEDVVWAEGLQLITMPSTMGSCGPAGWVSRWLGVKPYCQGRLSSKQLGALLAP
jgi:hypothetical protein